MFIPCLDIRRFLKSVYAEACVQVLLQSFPMVVRGVAVLPLSVWILSATLYTDHSTSNDPKSGPTVNKDITKQKTNKTETKTKQII